MASYQNEHSGDEDDERTSLLRQRGAANAGNGHGHSHGAQGGHGGHGEHGHSHGAQGGHGGHGEHGHSHGVSEGEAHGSEGESLKRATAKRAQRKLMIACVLCFFFMVAEVVGGFVANSLAIMTDAAHLLSDVAGFVISITAIHLASLPSTSKLSYGFLRAEILGAIISVLVIWVLTGILLYEAFFRFMDAMGPDPKLHTDGKVMFTVACIGLVVNLTLMKVLGHAHSHGPSGGHGHSHGDHGHSHAAPASGYGAVDDPEEQKHDGDAVAVSLQEQQEALLKEVENINVQAAYIHALGDLVQSVGVCIAGGLIWWRPEYQIADPIATFLFSLLVLFTTVGIMKSSVHVLMEATPEGVDLEKIHNGLLALDTVDGVHDLHIWSLTVGSSALSVHLHSTCADAGETLHIAREFLRSQGIDHTTIQVEHTDGDQRFEVKCEKTCCL
jgi:zinc transporter 2